MNSSTNSNPNPNNNRNFFSPFACEASECLQQTSSVTWDGLQCKQTATRLNLNNDRKFWGWGWSITTNNPKNDMQLHRCPVREIMREEKLNMNSVHQEHCTVVLGDKDFVIGRGKYTHPGNVTMRNLIQDHLHIYRKTSSYKAKKEIRTQVSAGRRFLRRLGPGDYALGN